MATILRGARVRRLLFATAAAISASSAPTLAAAADETVSAADTGTRVEEVVVSARKREERLLDVPVAASALNNAALNTYATTDLNQIGLLVPQVSIDHAASGSGAIITIRGVGAANVDAAIEQEVTVNIDGVPISRGRVIEQSTFDEQSFQVLKGPQSLYFGKNSPAGVLVVQSNSGTDTPEGYIRYSHEFNPGDVNLVEGAFGGPVLPGLTVRGAFHFDQMDGGYIQGGGAPIVGAGEPAFLRAEGIALPGSPFAAYPGSRNIIGRLTVSWKPEGQPFDATFKFLGSSYHDRGDSMASVTWSCSPGSTGPESLDFGSFFLGGPAYIQDPSGHCRNEQAGYLPRINSLGTLPAAVAAHYPDSNGGTPFTDIPTYVSSLTINYKITPHLTLTSVSGYYEYNETQFSNYDSTDMTMASGVNNDYYHQLSEELRLASSFNEPLNFTIGGFYEHARRSFHQDGSIGYLGPDPVTGKTDLFESIDYYSTDSYSAFGELNWKIIPTIEATGGARYTAETQFGNSGMTYLHALFAPFNSAAPVGERFIGQFTNYNISPQATLSWHARPNLMFYGAYRTGFQSGGFSTPAIISPVATVANQEFKPEKAYGGEIGAKFSLLGRTLNGDVTLYRYVYSNLQLTAFDTKTTSYFTQNAASSTSQGIEVNLQYQATRELGVHTALGYNRSRYDSFPGSQCWTGQPTSASGMFYTSGAPLCIGGVQDLAGQPLSRAPDWNVIYGFTYDRSLMNDWRFGFTADARYSSGYYLATNNDPFLWEHDYQTLDLSARVYDKHWELALIGRNITDAYYAVTGGDKPLSLNVGGDTTAGLGNPRQIILQLTYRY